MLVTYQPPSYTTANNITVLQTENCISISLCNFPKVTGLVRQILNNQQYCFPTIWGEVTRNVRGRWLIEGRESRLCTILTVFPLSKGEKGMSTH